VERRADKLLIQPPSKLTAMKILKILSAFLVLIFFACNNSATIQSKNEIAQTDSTSKTTSIDGAWELVWAKHNDTIRDVSKMPMFKMFHYGVFSLIARDSSRKISFAGFGDYELSGSNIYKERFRYHTYAPYTGAMDWQDYELKNDTLYFKGFSKVIIGGEDVTKGFLRIEEKRVKVKW
jgi:hypothetical protein